MPKIIVFFIVLLSFVNPVYVPFSGKRPPTRHFPCAESDTYSWARNYDDKQWNEETKNTFPFPFPCSCEFFGQGVKPMFGKTIRGNKNDNVWKKHLKGLGVFTRSLIIGVAPVSVTDGPCGKRREKIHNWYVIRNIYYIYMHILMFKSNLESTHHISYAMCFWNILTPSGLRCALRRSWRSLRSRQVASRRCQCKPTAWRRRCRDLKNHRELCVSMENPWGAPGDWKWLGLISIESIADLCMICMSIIQSTSRAVGTY